MFVARVWHVLFILICCGALSMRVKAEEYEVMYGDNFDNEIKQDQHDGDIPVTPCQAAELSRWDKLFVALEDSHMRQTALMEALEQRCEDPGVCRQCVSAIEAVCRGQAEQASARLQRGLVELNQEATEMQRRMSASLHLIRKEGAQNYSQMMTMLEQLLESSQEHSAKLQHLEACRLRGEETGRVEPVGAGHTEGRENRMATAGVGSALGVGLGPTQPIGAGYGEDTRGLGEGLSETDTSNRRRPGSVGAGLRDGLGMNLFSSSPKVQEVTSLLTSLDRGKLERSLVAIAMELKTVQAQLSLLSSEEIEG